MSLSNFSRNYQALRTIALGALLLLVLSHVGWALLYVQGVYGLQQQVYVVSDQGTFMAMHQAESYRSEVEVVDHIEKFTYRMFSHDAETYERHVEQALQLINTEEGLIIQQGFERDGLLEMYIRQGARWEAEIDTVVVDMSAQPMTGAVYWQQHTWVGETSRVIPAAARFNISVWPRSMDNRNGLLITKWNYIPYETQP